MKIVLIYPSYEKLLVSNLDPPINLIIVAESLRHHDVEIIDLRITKTIPDADIYGFSCSTPGYPQMVDSLHRIKQERKDAKTIIGGAHASALPRECLQDGFDKVFVGECDVTLPHIVADWNNSPDIILGELPLELPSYHILDFVQPSNYVRTSQKIYSLILSRGCVWRCRYCASNRKHRIMRIGCVTETLASLEEIRGLRFMDENFLIDKKWFFDVTSSLNIPYFIFARGEDLCDETMLNQLATSGCKVISVGFESGSQQIHKNARTGKDVERMVLGIHKAAKVGINIRLNLIIGLPGETWDTIKETVEKVNQLDFASYSLNHFVAYPGTYWYKDYEGSLSNLYCACGHNSGFCSSSLVGEWREYMLQNIRNDKKLLFRGASQRRQQGG